jgi:hypothetical protein
MKINDPGGQGVCRCYLWGNAESRRQDQGRLAVGRKGDLDSPPPVPWGSQWVPYAARSGGCKGFWHGGVVRALPPALFTRLEWLSL